jgi:hypothetical protein
VHSAHQFLHVCKLDMGECRVFVVKGEVRPARSGAARRAPCLQVYARGVCVYLVLYVCASVSRLVLM